MKGKRYVLFNTIIAALGGFLFGFDTAVISGTINDLQTVFALNNNLLGFTVSIALIGTIAGSLLVGKPGDKWGRRNVLIVLAVFYLLSALGSALAQNWHFFLFFRFIGGLAVGGASVMSPMYISEIAPSNLRGRLVAVNQFNVVAGIMIAFFSNYIIASIVEISAWRWMLGVEAFPALLFFVLLFFIPKSPRWLVKQGRICEAKNILLLLGLRKEHIDNKIDEIVASLKTIKQGKTESVLLKKYRFPLSIAMIIAVFNQFTGINAILYYAPRIFEMTGLSADVSLLQSVAIGITNMVFTIIAMFIIDRLGRKTLLLIGSVGMAFFLSLVSFSFYFGSFSGYNVMFYLVGFCAFFAVSQGAVIWVFISEIFPNRVRSQGQSIGSFTHWVMAAAISWLFPVIAREGSVGNSVAFLFFAVMMILQFFFVWRVMPETKSKSLEQIQKDLRIR